MQVTPMQCSLESYGEETVKNSSVFEWHKWFKGSLHIKITNEENAHHFLQ
jgi:hypothetical protein